MMGNFILSITWVTSGNLSKLDGDPSMKLDTSTIPAVAAREKIEPGKLERLLINGNAVLMGRDDATRIAIGKELRTKVNVNLGTSPISCDENEELEKM